MNRGGAGVSGDGWEEGGIGDGERNIVEFNDHTYALAGEHRIATRWLNLGEAGEHGCCC